MDKTTEINKRLIYLKKVISDEDEMPYEILHRTLEEIDKIISLVCGCSDNSQIVIAYDRSQLDAFIQTEFEEYGLADFKSSDKQWEQAWNTIQGNDTAWTYMSDACYEAETNLGQQVHEESEVQNA